MISSNGLSAPSKYAARLGALAAGAALVAHHAMAAVVVVDVNLTTGYNPPYNNHLYVNPAGTQFGIGSGFSGLSPQIDFVNTSLSFWATTTTVGFVGSSSNISTLSGGKVIDSGSNFITGATLSLPSNANGIFVGYSVPNQGVSSDQTWYGWAQLSTNSTAGTFSLTRYAFDDTGGAITTPSAIPEPGVSALLFGVFALGFIGFCRWRRGSGAVPCAPANETSA